MGPLLSSPGVLRKSSSGCMHADPKRRFEASRKSSIQTTCCSGIDQPSPKLKGRVLTRLIGPFTLGPSSTLTLQPSDRPAQSLIHCGRYENTVAPAALHSCAELSEELPRIAAYFVHNHLLKGTRTTG